MPEAGSMGEGGRRASAGKFLPEEPWRIPIARGERDQHENDAGIVALKTKALGFWLLVGNMMMFVCSI
jgi:hypothetical protein